MVNDFQVYATFSGLKRNLKKSEVASVGVLNGVIVVAYGKQSINLNAETLRILSIHFSYNEKLKKDKNFCDVLNNIQRLLKHR